MTVLRSPIRQVSVNPYVLVQASQASKLRRDWRGPMPVRFEVDGHPGQVWRTNLMPLRDGSFRLYLNGKVRKATGLAVGDVAPLDVQFDEEYRGGPQDPMPIWFRDSLRRNQLAKSGWASLAPSRQKELLRYFASLKSPDTQRRNVRRAIEVLAGGKGRFMGRSWNDDKNQNETRLCTD